MSTLNKPIDRPPLAVRLFDPVARRLLRQGLPMGPNALLTVRGRRSGLPRSSAVAVVEIGGRRWIQSAYGETNWVRNLRAAGVAEIRIDGRMTPVKARELDRAEAVAFFRETLIPYVKGMPLLLRLAGSVFVGDVLADPVAGAARHPVFEITP